jgi:hypothetical protein
MVRYLSLALAAVIAVGAAAVAACTSSAALYISI